MSCLTCVAAESAFPELTAWGRGGERGREGEMHLFTSRERNDRSTWFKSPNEKRCEERPNTLFLERRERESLRRVPT